MKVHCEVNNPCLKVIRYLIDNNLGTNVNKFNVGRIGLRNRLINFLVVPNTVPEVPCSHFRILADVIWRGGLYLKDVAHDQILIVALALNEEDVISLGLTALFDPLSP